MHLCTISVDRYLSLRYPMRFGRNKTRRRVTLKIVFVWLLSIAMSLPLSLMYSKVSIIYIFIFGQKINSFLVLLSFPGSRLGAGERHMPDSGSSVQARRLYCLLLHTAWRDAAHLLPDRSPASQTATESRRWTAHVSSDARLGEWLAGTGARIG